MSWPARVCGLFPSPWPLWVLSKNRYVFLGKQINLAVSSSRRTIKSFTESSPAVIESPVWWTLHHRDLRQWAQRQLSKNMLPLLRVAHASLLNWYWGRAQWFTRPQNLEQKNKRNLSLNTESWKWYLTEILFSGGRGTFFVSGESLMRGTTHPTPCKHSSHPSPNNPSVSKRSPEQPSENCKSASGDMLCSKFCQHHVSLET